ncbi:MAG: DNA-3-methyladenine glycosylase [Verrucomicrobiales bacterium]|nr:DNA-3-methyladenine glycosylase [Verrucomicrobiales bacterium]
MTEAALRHLSGADPVLARLIRRVGPCGLRPRRRRAPYEALVRSVLFQQLNWRAAEAIFSRLRALYPDTRFPSPNQLLRTPDAHLRAAGLSRNKIAAIKDIAAKTLEGIVPDSRTIRTLTDDEILDRLTTVRGVGPWTVQMLLIFTLGRPDVLPATDFGVRKGFALTYGLDALPRPAEVLAHGERWRPYRTTATWYLWRAVDMVNVLP